MNNHKQIKQDLVQDIIDLINQYNYTKELTTIMTRNFNEIDPNPAENETCGVGERSSRKLCDNFSKPFLNEDEKFNNNFSKIDNWRSKNFPEKISNK